MKYFLLIILTCTLATARAQIITTVAGDGSGPYSGEGGLATNASIGLIVAVTFDKEGNYYFAYRLGNRVLKVDIVTGIIHTVAGTGVGGFSGDGGLATNAQLDNPVSIAIDDSDNLFIADLNNKRVRKVSGVTGIITTYVGSGTGNGFSGDGGPAVNASLYGPAGVFIDKNENLYIGDANSRIRKVNASGIIGTIAGTGNSGYNGDNISAINAQISIVYSLWADGSQNVYFGDFTNYRVRKIDAATGIITTIAGTGTSGYNGDTIAATTANIAPFYITFDTSGNLYIADFHSRIRKVDAATNLIYTIAGSDTVGFSGDGGPAVDAKFNNVEGVAVDMCGNVYVADDVNKRIRKITYNPTCIPIDTTHHNEAVTNVAATDFSIYPNPANTEVTVNAGNGFINTIIISNTLGQQVYTTQYTHTTKTTIDISHYPQAFIF